MIQPSRSNVKFIKMVPKAGLEPAWIAPHAPQTCVSTSSTTSAFENLIYQNNSGFNYKTQEEFNTTLFVMSFRLDRNLFIIQR